MHAQILLLVERAKDTAGECEECGKTESSQWYGGARPLRAAAQGRDAVQQLLPETGMMCCSDKSPCVRHLN